MKKKPVKKTVKKKANIPTGWNDYADDKISISEIERQIQRIENIKQDLRTEKDNLENMCRDFVIQESEYKVGDKLRVKTLKEIEASKFFKRATTEEQSFYREYYKQMYFSGSRKIKASDVLIITSIYAKVDLEKSKLVFGNYYAEYFPDRPDTKEFYLSNFDTKTPVENRELSIWFVKL